MHLNREFIKQLYNDLQPSDREVVDSAVNRIVETKSKHAAGVSVDTQDDLARVEKLMNDMNLA